MEYSELVTQDIRLVILRMLAQDPDYSHNHIVLQQLLEQFGHSVSSDRMHTELSWLQEQGLVKVRSAGGIAVAKLTTRGDDVAQGRITVPGVQRPRPGE